jgi:hypothetical protein
MLNERFRRWLNDKKTYISYAAILNTVNRFKHANPTIQYPTMKHFFTLTCILFFVLFAKSQTRYVTETGSGNKDGTNWANAWNAKIFADTIITLPSGMAIWIAKGNYNPTKDSLGNVVVDDMFNFANRERTFMVPSGVSLYGGFAGTETSLDQRNRTLIDAVNRTSFDGGNVITHFPDMSNSWNLITLKNSSESTVIDGIYFYNFSRQAIFILSTINNTSDPTIAGCNFGAAYNNGEGAIYILGQGSLISKPKITGCYFNYNSYYTFFVPVYSQGSCKTEISNCIFSKSQNDHTCFYFQQTKGGSVTNCTLYANRRSYSSPPTFIINNITDSLNISNCIIRNDATPGSGYLYNFLINGNNLVALRNCNIQPQDHYEAVEPALQSGNIDVNPEFKDSMDQDGPDNAFGTTDDGLQLKITSPSINAGFNDHIPAIAVNDILGNHRVSGCTVDMGAYEYQHATDNTIVLPQSNVQSCTQYPVPGAVTTFIDPSTCAVAATVNPVGSNPVSGILQVCVVTDAAVPVVNGIPYVQRRYNIEPLQNATTSTARITVYYTQQEFDNYNTAAVSFPHLPTSPADIAGKANIRIEQNHGISLTGVPGTYNGETVYIDPDDNDIIWNSTSNIWEVSFDVTGFSGFFLTTAAGTIPVTLVNFSGLSSGNAIKLKWKTSAEYSFSFFEVEKSIDGLTFNSLQRVNASGNANGNEYNLNDAKPNSGGNYYRLKIVDIDGTFKYSSIVFIKYQEIKDQSLRISPNPARQSTTINVTGNLIGDASIVIFDAFGKKAAEYFLGKINTRSFSTILNLEKLTPGIFIINFNAGELKMTEKLIIQ